MATKKKSQSLTLDKVKDKFIGKKGTAKREEYELDLRLDLIGQMIRKARKEKNLTQQELGKLVGVQKAQISKLENGSTNVTVGTIIKVFEALKAKVKFKIEMKDSKAL